VYTPADDAEAASSTAEPFEPLGTSAVAFAGVLTLLLGVFPGILYGLAEKASLL